MARARRKYHKQTNKYVGAHRLASSRSSAVGSRHGAALMFLSSQIARRRAHRPRIGGGEKQSAARRSLGAWRHRIGAAKRRRHHRISGGGGAAAAASLWRRIGAKTAAAAAASSAASSHLGGISAASQLCHLYLRRDMLHRISAASALAAASGSLERRNGLLRRPLCRCIAAALGGSGAHHRWRHQRSCA